MLVNRTQAFVVISIYFFTYLVVLGDIVATQPPRLILVVEQQFGHLRQRDYHPKPAVLSKHCYINAN